MTQMLRLIFVGEGRNPLSINLGVIYIKKNLVKAALSVNRNCKQNSSSNSFKRKYI
jgi:hypothetical protein